MVEYSWTRAEPVLDRTTGYVTGWILGLTATDGMARAYIDALVPVNENKPLSKWTKDEVLALAEAYARNPKVSSVVVAEGEGVPQKTWYEQLADQLASQANAPVYGPALSLVEPPPLTPEKIDLETGQAITQAIHPEAGIEEQIGIIREQLVLLLNRFGIEATPEFARFNAIASAKITEARRKKGVA